MSALVKAVACPQQEVCPVEVETWMAMPRIRDKPSGEELVVKNRGDFGRMSDLTDAVKLSLEKWRTELGAPSTPATLIANMSLAYEPEKKGLTWADQAVLAVLNAASCHEVLMFAAAGNYSTGLYGLPYPAAWQTTPTAAEIELCLAPWRGLHGRAEASLLDEDRRHASAA